MADTTTHAPAPGMPATAPGVFRVAGKHMLRASIIPLQMGTRADGSPNIVQQPGPMERLDVGTELTDVTMNELKAFGDRLEPVDDAAKQSLREARGMDQETLTAAAESSGVPPAEVPLPPVGAPSSPAEAPKPPQPVQEMPEVVSARQEAERRATRGQAPAPAATPPPSHTPPSEPSTAEAQRRRGTP